MPKPVVICSSAVLDRAPTEIAASILDVEEWTDFAGYGPIPGIASARFLERTANVVGSRIEVVNDDGSQHVEEIVGWNPTDRLQLRLGEFVGPLARLASHFDEEWRFTVVDAGTRVERSMTLHPCSVWTRPALLGIGAMLRRALDRHLTQMALDQ